MHSYGDFGRDEICKILGMEPTKEPYKDMTMDEFDDALRREIDRLSKIKPGKMLLQALYKMSRDSEDCRYFYLNDCRYANSGTLNDCYGLLCSLGYVMSDEEKALRYGTHELFESKE